MDRERLLAHGRHRVRHRQGSPHPGRRRRDRRHRDVPQPLGSGRQARRAAQAGPRARRTSRTGRCPPSSRRPCTASTAPTSGPTSTGRRCSRRSTSHRRSSSSSARTPRYPSSSTTGSPARRSRPMTGHACTSPDTSPSSPTPTTASATRNPAPSSSTRPSSSPGEAMKKDFKDAAAEEIDAFKAEFRLRNPGADADAITDEDLLREVMNTVGKKGMLGADVRCVVSVAMLTEGWDANTVTHILGIRAFKSQLLCEQVVGRGLRRRSYAVNDEGRFEAEYANVYGVPFMFIGGKPPQGTPPPLPATEVRTVPGREAPAHHLPQARRVPARGPRRAALAPRRARALRHRPGHRPDLDRVSPCRRHSGARRGRRSRRSAPRPSPSVSPSGSSSTTSPWARRSTIRRSRRSPGRGSFLSSSDLCAEWIDRAVIVEPGLAPRAPGEVCPVAGASLRCGLRRHQ